MRVTVGYIPEVSNSIFPHAVTSVASILYAYLNPNKRPCLRVVSRIAISSNESSTLVVIVDPSKEEIIDENWELDIPNVYMRYRVEVEFMTTMNQRKTSFQHPIVDVESVRL